MISCFVTSQFNTVAKQSKVNVDNVLSFDTSLFNTVAKRLTITSLVFLCFVTSQFSMIVKQVGSITSTVQNNSDIK